MPEGVNDMSPNTTELTPGQRRIAKAQTKRLRAADEKLAEKLRGRGWTVIAPEDMGAAIQSVIRP
jgi:hypothetical protein